MGTGAFSKMNTGDRTVSVRVVNDANSFLGLRPTSDGFNGSNEHGQFAEYEEGKLLIQIDGSNTQRAKGVNPDSEYYFDRVFEIVNKDADRNEHHVWISSNTADPVDFYWKGDPSNSAEGPNNSKQTTAGSVHDVGMYVDATDLDPDGKRQSNYTLNGDIVISAENTAND